MRKVIMVMLLLISNTAFSGVCLIDTISKVTYVNSVEDERHIYLCPLWS